MVTVIGIAEIAAYGRGIPSFDSNSICAFRYLDFSINQSNM
jgi:hypothetical protein